MDDLKEEAIEAVRALHDGSDGHSKQELIDALRSVKDEVQSLLDELTDF